MSRTESIIEQMPNAIQHSEPKSRWGHPSQMGLDFGSGARRAMPYSVLDFLATFWSSKK